jgi:cyclophilin family peptidyl-prolyl cis-trans isomerase
VSNFVRLVREGFYDGLPWHRVVPNFVIQGGDPLGSGWGGPGYALPDEINRRRFLRGTVGMPKAGKDTGGCQIFITHAPTPHLDGNYTVFGQVTSGLDVVDQIEVGDSIERAYLKR